MSPTTTTCPTCGTHLRAVDGLCPSCLARSISTLITPRGIAASEDEPDVPGYDLEEIIGRGGMGIVFRAVRLSDDLPVAVKLMPAHLADRGDLAERFAREVQALSSLDHPHILRVLDSGIAADGRWFLVTELAEGGDLAAKLKAGPLPVQDSLRIFRETVSAIGEAHRRNIAHRDIKPANILLTDDGSVRVGDFSLAKLLRDEGLAELTLTRSAEVFGTPYYIAPEVRRGAAGVDERADFFSLGVLLHEMLTGRLPLGEYEPASRLAAVPRGVDALIAQCLAEDPARRPQSAESLLAALDAALRPALPSRVVLAATLAIVVMAAGWFVFANHSDKAELSTSHEEPVAWPSLPPPPDTLPPPPGPGSSTQEQPWVNSLGMKFVPVKGAGALFCIWETRNRDFAAFARSDPRAGLGRNQQWRSAAAGITPDHPVEQVSLQQGALFCQWLTDTEHSAGVLPPHMAFRLPTDDEWSRAALLDSETGTTPEERHRSCGEDGHAPYAWGRTWLPPDSDDLSANFALKAQHDAFARTARVGAFKANRLGLHDLGGNVSEWCSTRWNAATDDRVLRGGAWLHSKPGDMRLDARLRARPDDAPEGAGFRVVLDLGGR